MPPFGGKDAKATGRHGFAQHAAQTDMFGTQHASAQPTRFITNMGGGTEIVNGSSHRKPGGVACCMEQTAGAVANVTCPTEGEVDGQPIVVQPASVGGITDVDIFGRVRDDVPHALLYAHGACGIVHFEGVVGMFLLQCVLSFAQRTSGFG